MNSPWKRGEITWQSGINFGLCFGIWPTAIISEVTEQFPVLNIRFQFWGLNAWGELQCWPAQISVKGASDE